MGTEIIKLYQENFHKICRICYQQNDLKNLFQSKYRIETFHTILERVVAEEISRNDGLPPYVCFKCVKSLLYINAFLDQYERSNEDLKSVYDYLFNNNDTTVENGPKYMQVSRTTIPDQDYLLSDCSFVTNAIKEETPLIDSLITPIKTEEVETLIIKNEVLDDDHEPFEFEPRKGSREHPNRKDLKLHCLECNRYFKSRSGFQNHQKADHPFIAKPNEEFICAICKRMYRIKYKLQKHLTVSHNRLTCVCDKCGLTVKRYSFVNHLKTHEKEGPLKHLCTVCGATVKYSLSIHMKKHHNKGEKYKCDHCPYETVYLHSLQRHNLRHTNGKLFRCEMCCRDFSVKYFFDKHMTSHAPFDQPIACDFCSKLFNTKFEYDKHVTTTHSARKISTLEDYLSRKQNYEKLVALNKIKAVEHSIDVGGKLKKPAKRCEECGKICYNYTTYIDHMKFEHEIDKRTCRICNKRIRGFMSIHMKTHEGLPNNKKCVPCNKIFNTPAHLKRHTLLIHENIREHKCPHCEKDFKMANQLEDHIRIHTGETLKCDYCEKTFKQSSTRYKHLREVHNIRLGQARKKKIIEHPDKSIINEQLELMEEYNTVCQI